MKGRSPFKKLSSPSCKEDIPIMERGTEGVRLRPRGLKPEGLINSSYPSKNSLVLGSSPVIRSSILVAVSKALPKALNRASTL